MFQIRWFKLSHRLLTRGFLSVPGDPGAASASRPLGPGVWRGGTSGVAVVQEGVPEPHPPPAQDVCGERAVPPSGALLPQLPGW